MKNLLYPFILFFLLTACGKSDDLTPPDKGEDPVVPENVKRTVVVYATNRSSLSADFSDDKEEMLKALENINLNEYQLLIFYSDSESTSGLFSANHDKNTGDYIFTKIKEYDRKHTTTDPNQISQALHDALKIYPNSEYDLVFWGHGMSWYPYFTDHDLISRGMLYSYGGEYDGGIGPNGYPSTNWTEIDELAAAVPDHKFDTIWFDCCYMSGIEVLYEFKDKCNSIVAYPTEVWENGLPYDLVLPYLLSDKHDLVGGAKEFFNYYTLTKDPVTVAVCDMSKIEDVAANAKRILESGDSRPTAKTLINYSRASATSFYDFRQFISETAEANGASGLIADFIASLDKFVVYHAESPYNFNKKYWNTDNISGISTHFYKGLSTPEEEYYRSLKWFKRVYEND